MHTFFINTSEKVAEKLKDGIYQDLLFEEQIAKKTMIIPNLFTNCDPDSIKKCADAIADRIDQEADVDEKIALIVYLESSERALGSPDYLSARMLAEEYLLCLQVEKTLVWTLCNQGKRPGNLIFIFGERVRRDPTLLADKVFTDSIKENLWKQLRLPSGEKTLNFIKGESAGKKKRTSPDLLLPTESELKSFLTDNHSDDESYISNHCDFLAASEGINGNLLDDLVGNILARAAELMERLSCGDLYDSLDDVLNEYKNDKLRDRINSLYAESVEYNFIPLKYKDIHEDDQSICRLMLYIYAVANNFNASQRDMITLPEKSNDIYDAACIPEVNYPVFKQALSTMADRCRKGVYSSAKIPAGIAKKLEEKSPLITSVHKPPQLTLDRVLDGFLDAGGIKRIFVSISRMRTAVDNILGAAKDKNDRNHKEFVEYLNRTASEYDRIKDDALKNVAFTEDLPEIPDINGSEVENRFDEMKNIENKVQGMIIARELRLLESPEKMYKEENVQKLIDRTRDKADYYFDGLKRRLLFYLAGIVCVILVLVPYYFLRKEIFNIQNGKYFFWGTGGVCLLMYLIGHIIFIAQYKNVIFSLMEEFIRSFNKIQRSNVLLLEHYRSLLYQDIPGYFAIWQYDMYLRRFKEEYRERREKITYHEKSRKDRIEKIKSLLDDLDSAKNGELPAELKESNSRTKWEIDPDGDRIANKGTYILSAKDVRKSLTYEEKDAENGGLKNE